MFDKEMLSILVCPICKNSLQHDPGGGSDCGFLVCLKENIRFPIQEGIPVLLVDQAIRE